MDNLEDKANEAIQNEPVEKELYKIIKEEFNISNKNQIAFIIEYVKNGGKIAKAYRLIYGSHINVNTASHVGGRILRRIDMSRLLDYSGHGIDKMFSAMDKLYEDDPASYMKFQTKLRNLDNQKVELSGEIKVPIINIVTDRKNG